VKFKKAYLSLALPLLLLAQPSFAQDEEIVKLTSIQEMAAILATMSGQADEQQRNTLSSIAASPMVTANEKTLAEVITKIDGSIAPDDKSKIYGIFRDAGGGQLERELAKVVTSFRDQASKQQLNKLEALMPPRPVIETLAEEAPSTDASTETAAAAPAEEPAAEAPAQ